MSQAKNSTLMDEVEAAVRAGLKVAEGEVLTAEILEQRVGNITMAVFAALPPIHRIKVVLSASGVTPRRWSAEPDINSNFYGTVGIAFTARDAVVNFFKELYWTCKDRSQEGAQLFEIDAGKLP